MKTVYAVIYKLPGETVEFATESTKEQAMIVVEQARKIVTCPIQWYARNQPATFYFWDANNYRWVWIEAEHRVVLDVPSELADPESGYGADSLEEAIQTLMDGDYMEGEFHPINENINPKWPEE